MAFLKQLEINRKSDRIERRGGGGGRQGERERRRREGETETENVLVPVTVWLGSVIPWRNDQTGQ